MGCDIHDYCEIKTDNGWEMLGDVFDNWYYNTKKEHPFDMRCYPLFGLLAGVRNHNVPPIRRPKGIPQDVSEGYLAIVNEWNGEGHDHSYHTLKELLEYPLYDELIEIEGDVSSEEYRIFKQQGKPNEYFGGISGPLYFHISNEEMKQYLDNSESFINRNLGTYLYSRKLKWESHKLDCPAYHEDVKLVKDFNDGIIPKGLKFYTRIKWQIKIREYINKWWFDKTLPQMKELAPNGDYNKIRMVFFFDN